ncbi:site-specific integrase [Paracidovorax konjaci]|uniref:Uncharacterized protein n=1 Tax=Paracidovorax konjaci TaxID=32040 RepID=A0A1I1TUK2_9BURK|nr:site-specific integrase [Paracidovorax konjaci]SFD62366.1 hypothetical protein SAMN04489710_10472 [Paracidovorax konjaci]
MQVNLSNQIVILKSDGLSEAIRCAKDKATKCTETNWQDVLPDVVGDLQVNAVVGKLWALAEVPSEFQASAALVLLELAIAGYMMLPAVGPSLFVTAPVTYKFELPPLLARIDAWVHQRTYKWRSKGNHLQLILATDYRVETKFALADFSRLHAWLIDENSVDGRSTLNSPAYGLLQAIEDADPAVLNRDERHSYILWRASNFDARMTLDEFVANPLNMSGMRVHGHGRERLELPEHVERRKVLEAQRKEKKRDSKAPSPFLMLLHSIARSDEPTSPEDYFAELGGGSNVKGFRPDLWIEEPVNYPGRESIDILSIGARWFTAFKAFLAKRRIDYETEKQVRGALHLLADYILLYLPWWLELHPDSNLKFPESPKDFLRYFYVDRTRFHSEDEKTLGALPKTLYELLPFRRPTPGSRNVSRLVWAQFFNIIATYFEDDENFVKRGMQNPIRIDFDNELAGRAGKTDKIPFAEDVYPFLVQYGQAVEAFGEFLQQEAYFRDRFKKIAFGVAGGYCTAEWGYVPIFWYRSRIHRVEWIPNIYLVSKRTLQSNSGSAAGIYVSGQRINVGRNRNFNVNFPHLTTVRLLLSLAETGLRGQSLQWLDRRTFDQFAPKIESLAILHGNPDRQNYHSLYINTDKTHEEWRNLISWRVRRSLLAEARFQESLVDQYGEVEVDYEDRAHSRFAPVLPIFRSDRSSKPISDSSYSSRWVDYLYGFQKFYNSKEGVDRSGSQDALVLLKERDEWEEGDAISDIFLAIHTPHSCRATYATLKDGELEISEIAEQLGHSNTVVTSVYQVPQLKRLQAKLKSIDEKMLSADTYDPVTPEILHTERPDSPVRAAFGKDREQAISDFGFVPGVALWSLSELDGDSTTLEILQHSPASMIQWHPTHVCPVGNQCPREVVANAGGMNRCGVCPLAAKCIDHLPAIEAKQRQLLERIRTNTVRQKQFEQSENAQLEIDALHREKSLDTKELLGWKLSAEILRSRLRQLDGDTGGYHVDQPELVRKQLELVTRNRSESEFFLQRIADSNALPSLESPEIRARALRYTRLILASQDRLKEAAFLEVSPHNETVVFASFVKPYIQAKGLSLEQLGAALDEVSKAAALPISNTTPLLPGA